VTLSIALEDTPTRTSHVPFVDVREDGRLLYSVPISQVFTVSDSTRYFVIQSLTGTPCSGTQRVHPITARHDAARSTTRPTTQISTRTRLRLGWVALC
jgi:hypothetical protein